MGGISETVIRMAVDATEEEFEAVVVDAWPTNPQLASVGSCCLLGVICNARVYIANIGDSRAVLGSVYKSTGTATALQLTSEHNVAIEAVREELKARHPDDPHIVLLRHGVWRVKGIIQVFSFSFSST
jgi:pyruvate dehydrogenase phosphatase